MHLSDKLYITHSAATSGGCPVIIMPEHLAQYSYILLSSISIRDVLSLTLWHNGQQFLCVLVVFTVRESLCSRIKYIHKLVKPQS